MFGTNQFSMAPHLYINKTILSVRLRVKYCATISPADPIALADTDLVIIGCF